MRKEIIQQIINKNPDAVLVKNKYKVIAGMLRRMYPDLEPLKDKLPDIIFDAVNADRDWRMLTEGLDKENKEINRQQWIVNNYMK